jgi:hypothetical protein
MGSTRIVYTPHPDATPETEASVLASVYGFLLDRHAQKEVAHPGGSDDATKGFGNSEKEKGGRHVEH